jgi:murein DD-endopeptidase MepM/ murein hydrolase activator NlpD
MQWKLSSFLYAAAALLGCGYVLKFHSLESNPRPKTTLNPDSAMAQVAQTPPPTMPAAASLASLGTAALDLASVQVIVTPHDTLERIFRRLQLSLNDLAALTSLPELTRNIDQLRPGEALKLLHRDGSLMAFERQLSPSETLKVTRESDGFKADILENPLEIQQYTARGVINSSLFEAVNVAGASDQTALALSEIFGWDIDFVLDIQPGDSFVFTYEQIYQDGAFIKDGPILAASFINAGREYRAVRYTTPAGLTQYYSPEGRSLQRAFLRAPLEFSRVSSGFNLRRKHPVLNRIRAHRGVDYAAPTGTPIRAAGDGRVRFLGQKGGYGRVIELDHSRGVVTLYGHLSKFSKSLRAGQRVKQGSIIGYVGMSGLATGPHLHYEYRVNGVYKDPQKVKLPEAPSLDPKWLSDFEHSSQPLLASLKIPLGSALVSR